MQRLCFIILTVIINTSAAYCADTSPSSSTNKTFVVGTENINYYPHYNVINPEQKGFLSELLILLSAHLNVEFIQVALPNKRLHLALEQGVVDFAYPDNPDWGKTAKNKQLTKHYSTPLTHALGGTMVLKSNKGVGIRSFDSLAVPFGFTPIKWQPHIQANNIRLVEVPDALSALELVSLGRVGAADIEYHVASNLIRQHPKLSNLTLDPHLPYDVVGFSLSRAC